jgi:hypothetical protein
LYLRVRELKLGRVCWMSFVGPELPESLIHHEKTRGENFTNKSQLEKLFSRGENEICKGWEDMPF